MQRVYEASENVLKLFDIYSCNHFESDRPRQNV